jgi:glycogen phosphorylase/synthase
MEDKAQTPYVFEVSWEVCNKVGGIYEVVSSKALSAVEAYEERYFMLGPDLHHNAHFIETDESCWVPIRNALKAREISCRFGRWDIPGKPKVILVSFADRHQSNVLLHKLWEQYGVDSLSGGWDYIEPVLFSYTCGEVISTVYTTMAIPQKAKAVAHFHEWMCGAGLLAVKKLTPAVGTVFTTHATMLGRAMAGSNMDIYAKLKTISPVREAAAYNITAKCSMETVSAREADVFTTVSGITRDEAAVVLGRTADIVTTNGLDMRVIHDFSKDRAAAHANRNKMLEPLQKLLRRDIAKGTRIFVISGRYEFRNKGIDIFLEALARVQQALHNTEKHVLALCLVMGGHTGPDAAAIGGEQGLVPDSAHPEWGFIASHQVYDKANDPILNACARLGLHNRADSAVNVVFVPAMLDGFDGFLNMQYFEVLSGCHLGVFPSWYEPWGYTPHESAAYGVPTVTSDLSGYGIWAREQEERQGDKEGVTVLPRMNKTREEIVDALSTTLLHYATCSDADLDKQRLAVRALSDHTSWNDFFCHYKTAYTQALRRAQERSQALYDARKQESLNKVITARSSAMPYLRTVTVVATLPVALARLRDIAENIWWCWQPDAVDLFRDLDPRLWESTGHNPIRMIEEAAPEKLSAMAVNPSYLLRYAQVVQAFDAYMQAPPSPLALEAQEKGIDAQHPIAYFSTEFGLHESVPLYSGGLGVLSGDHLKSSSDVGMPLIAIGLLYHNGYFRQSIDAKGTQIPLYPENKISELPLKLVRDMQDEALEVQLDLPGRPVYACVWRCQVGRIPLYLLDTDIPKNSDEDRRITSRLYEADRDVRLRQEMLLGMGGVMLTRKLGLAPAVFHMNEGHSAFLVLERIHHCLHDGLSLAEAVELVRGSCVFTTHTPVDAGNERFSVDQIARYFTTFASHLGLSWQAFLQLGQKEDGDPHVFDMTVLALKHSGSANAVSWLHGYVSRSMWVNIWKGLPVPEVPIGSITNGVHTASYVGAGFRTLLRHALGEQWLDCPPNDSQWQHVAEIPDAMYWEAKRFQKVSLLNFLREKMQKFAPFEALGREEKRSMLQSFSPEALVIGFARRFAPYKRGSMLFSDPERLARLLGRVDRPVVLIFAGKAHPADRQGIDLIRDVIKNTINPRFLGKVFFVEDYSLAVSKMLAQGCDVWLNTPRRPYEASGTSGMKVPVNGGINLSISDGWWVEGFQGNNGWTIGPVVSSGVLKEEQDDYADAESLYNLLEEQVIPLYFERGEDGLPHQWIRISKQSLISLTAQYSSHRMVRQYFNEIYAPAALRGAALECDRMALARRLAAWRARMDERFGQLSIAEIRIEGMQGETLQCGQPIKVFVRVVHGSLQAQELLVQLVIGPAEGKNFINTPECVTLHVAEEAQPQADSFLFEGQYTASGNGQYAYGVRVMPWTEGLDTPLLSNHLLWG